MARVSTYLNFSRNTEEAFEFYKSVFGTEYNGEISRMKDVPPDENQQPLSEEDQNLVMHVELPITGGHVLMGTDAPESMGFILRTGNNMYINLEPDTQEETERLFSELSAGGTIEMPLASMFWGGYFGSFIDKYGVNWMLNYTPEQPAV